MNYTPEDYDPYYTHLKLSFDCAECHTILEAGTPVIRFGKGRGICLSCYEVNRKVNPNLPSITDLQEKSSG